MPEAAEPRAGSARYDQTAYGAGICAASEHRMTWPELEAGVLREHGSSSPILSSLPVEHVTLTSVGLLEPFWDPAVP
jgi:hypothetical protein